MDERRTHQRRQGPIRTTERRQELDVTKARTARGSDRRKSDRRGGIDRRRHTIDGRPLTSGAA